jgi:hypothetical protein
MAFGFGSVATAAAAMNSKHILNTYCLLLPSDLIWKASFLAVCDGAVGYLGACDRQ